ncbi:Oidioi.mRNA.OKI2018_I69.chr1.g3482.t1.cds [Oikopleura dioica]|uniref:Oidioi.mRNA.OKI2018_I69.chr1.g3482.t1.cds n=1 Tax=Oikopleura dioica TaxID=34765 RepID=A0ABN7T133_OIKDI|nr:Oidioi.mRNA.OKI2018_I69.chr1.g3482.t1.cds [Oikopleura dioica]
MSTNNSSTPRPRKILGKTPFIQHPLEKCAKSEKISQEKDGDWDRAWLEEMGLLSIFFESPKNPKPVTVSDPQTEEMYQCFVYEQKLEIVRRKEEKRQEFQKEINGKLLAVSKNLSADDLQKIKSD